MDLRNYNAAQHRQDIMRRRAERFSTVYAVAFLPRQDGGSEPDYFAAAYSTGEIRLFRHREVVQAWLGAQRPGSSQFSFQAHQGAVYTLAVFQHGPLALLISGGEDGIVRGFSIAQLLQACECEAPQPAGAAPPQPVFELQMPRTSSVLGSSGQQAAALTVSLDAPNKRLYAGTQGAGSTTALRRATQGASTDNSRLPLVCL